MYFGFDSGTFGSFWSFLGPWTKKKPSNKSNFLFVVLWILFWCPTRSGWWRTCLWRFWLCRFWALFDDYFGFFGPFLNYQIIKLVITTTTSFAKPKRERKIYSKQDWRNLLVKILCNILLIIQQSPDALIARFTVKP